MSLKPHCLMLLALFMVPLACSGSGSQGDVIDAAVAPEEAAEVASDAAADAPSDSADAAPDVATELPPDVAGDVAIDLQPDLPTDISSETAADGVDDTQLDVPPDVQADALPDLATEVSYPDLNNCSKSAAVDKTGQASVTVAFGGAAGFAYSPACLTVSAGTTLVFEGSFSFHPLNGGEAGSPDAASPFMPATTSGTSAQFTLPTPGIYGFYCGIHWASGMKGAVYVE